jgi:serine/threonine protein kinase
LPVLSAPLLYRKSDEERSAQSEIFVPHEANLTEVYSETIFVIDLSFRDVKSSNILLDADWNAKVADFGLSKAVQTNSNLPSSSTFVRGTPGGRRSSYLICSLNERCLSIVFLFGWNPTGIKYQMCGVNVLLSTFIKCVPGLKPFSL